MNKEIKNFSKKLAKYLKDTNQISENIIWDEAEIATAELFPDYRDSYEITERIYEYTTKYLKL